MSCLLLMGYATFVSRVCMSMSLESLTSLNLQNQAMCKEERPHAYSSLPAQLYSYILRTSHHYFLDPWECKHCKICFSLMPVPYFTPETSGFGQERLVSQKYCEHSLLSTTCTLASCVDKPWSNRFLWKSS